MSSGSFVMVVPHFCGELINVHVKWWQDRGTYFEPSSSDIELSYTWQHFDEVLDGGDFTTPRCPKCNVDLELDELFQASVQKKMDSTTDWNEDPQERDYEPDDPSDGWDEVWEKIDPRYN